MHQSLSCPIVVNLKERNIGVALAINKDADELVHKRPMIIKTEESLKSKDFII
jgi:hypothetical protein